VARRRSRDHLALSLLPFLSVLACVIGTLTLLLAALAVGSLGGAPLEQIRLAEQFEALEAFLSGGSERLELLEAQLRRSEHVAKESEELGLRLAGLGLSPDISLEDLEGVVDLVERREEADRQKRRLGVLLDRSEADLAKRADAAAQRSALQLRAPIVIDPTGLGPDRRPYLVECTRDYIELHRTKGDWTYRIQRNEIRTSPDFPKFLRRVSVIHDSIVIFMIRPDGVQTFHEAEMLARQHNVRHAKLPLPGQGELDFGLF
jgi:hypothetical protein